MGSTYTTWILDGDMFFSRFGSNILIFERYNSSAVCIHLLVSSSIFGAILWICTEIGSTGARTKCKANSMWTNWFPLLGERVSFVLFPLHDCFSPHFKLQLFLPLLSQLVLWNHRILQPLHFDSTDLQRGFPVMQYLSTGCGNYLSKKLHLNRSNCLFLGTSYLLDLSKNISFTFFDNFEIFQICNNLIFIFVFSFSAI